ncbi:MAG: glycosyltransferase, partial [Giesbergeria sp.]
LRRKRQTDPARITALRAEGLAVQVVVGWSHVATIWQLVRQCRRFRPDLLVAHGFSEHLWGRYAGWIARVPVLVHVEHNSRERYTGWRNAQMLWLGRRTQAIVGVSEGVREALLARGVEPAKTLAIPNGVRLGPYAAAAEHPFEERSPGIVMVARFARQKDHASLLHALALLRERGLTPPLLLAGGGKATAQKQAERLCKQLKLQEQVRFLGRCDDVPGLLMAHQVCVLSTHYEGMPLALIEGMAAGCAVVGSAVEGVREVVQHERNGLLVLAGDPAALADALERLLKHPKQAAVLAVQARADAVEHYGLPKMLERYESLFLRLIESATSLETGE